MFIDKVRIYLKAGSGGNGCLSFRREYAVPFGGPDGGSGGSGGSIYLEADPNRTTLVDFTYKPHFTAQSGIGGKGKDKHGKGAKDMVIYLPCGTVVYKNNKFFHDLKNPGERILVARGGRGGRGNASFKTHRNTAPRIKEQGEPGEETVLNLELKIIADVGLVGIPNAGKSTLLSRISAARPQIADYPFTTLTPNLGVVKYNDNSFVVADIPGLIEGAHEGKGLGIDFLRHIERTKVLIHVVDMFGFEEKSAWENYNIITKELSSYGEQLMRKPVVVALNKADLTDFEEHKKKFIKDAKKKKIHEQCYSVSAVTGAGIKELLGGVAQCLLHAPGETEKPVEETIKRYTLDDEFTIEVINNQFMVKGRKVEKLAAMTPTNLEESVHRLQHIFKKMGLNNALKKKGINQGDTVCIGKMTFLWEEN